MSSKLRRQEKLEEQRGRDYADGDESRDFLLTAPIALKAYDTRRAEIEAADAAKLIERWGKEDFETSHYQLLQTVVDQSALIETLKEALRLALEDLEEAAPVSPVTLAKVRNALADGAK